MRNALRRLKLVLPLSVVASFFVSMMVPIAAHAAYSNWVNFVQTTNNCSYGQSRVEMAPGNEFVRATTRNNQKTAANCPSNGGSGTFRNLPPGYIGTGVWMTTGINTVCGGFRAPQYTTSEAARKIVTGYFWGTSQSCSGNRAFQARGYHEIWRPNLGYYSQARTVSPYQNGQP